MVLIKILQIIFGLAMLFLGRRLFWVFIGAMGFITATEYAVSAMAAQPPWVVVLVGLAVGIIGAILAIYFQAGGFALAGLLGGGYLGLFFTRSFQISNQTAQVIAYVIGAILGVVLFLIFFDSALIVTSSFIGSYVLVQQLDLVGVYFWLALVIIAFIGAGVQLKQIGSSENTQATSA